MAKKFGYGLACAFAFASLASATILTSGTTGAPSGFSDAGWTLLASTGPQSISSGTFTATANAWVYSDTNNTFCSGCLDFVYQVALVSGPDPIERITAGSFTGFSTDVGFLTVSTGVTPGSVDRSVNDSVIGFNYGGALALTGTESTKILVIETNTNLYRAGLMSAIDQQAANGVGFEPASVPEASSITMLGGGLVILGILRVRRKSPTC
jgi:hypothetical protein